MDLVTLLISLVALGFVSWVVAIFAHEFFIKPFTK